MSTCAAPPKVLVVDDDSHLADLYATWLDDAYDVETAYGGEDALERLDELDGGVDAVLLDRRMPDIDGDLVLVLLRDRGFDCPVAMVTAVEPTVDIVEMGFDDYLTKPVPKDELLERVEALVSLDSVDSMTRELSTLRVKRNVLSVELSAAERARSTEFATLERRIDALERRLSPAGAREGVAD
jgi:two-component system response regulator AdeR